MRGVTAVLLWVVGLTAMACDDAGGQRVCEPKGCAVLGVQCGQHDDGCGGQVQCGSCGDAFRCEQGQCVPGECTVTTCDALGVSCGAQDDGCGGVLACGSCGPGFLCEAGACMPGTCEPQGCAVQGVTCGAVTDGCGGVTHCGDCDPGWLCDEGQCQPAVCVPATCDDLGLRCGEAPDGCGGTLSCGPFEEGGLFEDQDFVIPSDAEAGDTVGVVRLFPTLWELTPRFSWTTVADPRFALDPQSGGVTLASVADLSPGSIALEVRAEVGCWRDTARLQVQVLDAAEVVYIDPSATGGEAPDGSRARPFRQWEGITWRAGKAYLQRRGTRAVESAQVAIGANDVLLGAYGQGPRPVIDSSAQHGISGWRKSGLVVRDLEVVSSATSSINWSSPTDLYVVGVLLHGGTWGMRFTGDPSPQGIRVMWSEVHSTGDDGFFIQNAEDIELGALYVHNVNTHWQPPETPENVAAGDGIQLHRVHRFHVHHSRLDRTSTGNKFALIANECSHGIIEHNVMSGPKLTPVGGATVYLGGTPLTYATVLRYNTFLGPAPTALYSHLADLQVIGNLFVGMPRAVWTNGTAALWHNVFHDVELAVNGGGTLQVHNNIFSLFEAQRAYGSVGDLTHSHNLYRRDPEIEGASVGDPRFVDPAALDFRLLPDSPAIDAGLDLGVAVDRMGTPIPRGAAPDIGAFEHR